MVWWAALLMAHFCWGLNGAVAGSEQLERIEQCRTQCSQGLRCKSKPDYLFPPPCQKLPEGLDTASVFRNVSLSTVMKCEGRQRCSLHLRTNAALQLAKSIHGVSICTMSAGLMTKCQIISFTKASREKLAGQQVEVENDCTDVSPSQQVTVTVKTLPSFCGVTWTGTYQAPGCSSEDLRKHIPECITGHLSYIVNPEKKELSVHVSDMLEDHDYHLRLCQKDFICIGTGTNALITKEQPVKSAILQYSKPLPCLCIEGWSAVVDALRVQVCPFRQRLDELWTGITFQPLEETLTWEPACPVTAVVSLCQGREDGVCGELPGSSQNVSRKKITFTKVDPHPELCLKFTAGSDSWTRCPFADRRLQAWEVIVPPRREDKVKLLSQITASFSVGLCVTPAASGECHVTATRSLHVEKNKVVELNLEGEPCNFCIQVKRLDVKFAPTVTHCVHQCSESPALRSFAAHQKTGDLTWVVVLASACLSAVIIATLVLHVMLSVYQKRKQKRNQVCSSQREIDPELNCAASASQTGPTLRGDVLVPDSPQCGNNEKANLISN